MATAKKNTKTTAKVLPITDKRSKAYKDSQKDKNKRVPTERVIGYLSPSETATTIKMEDKKYITHDERIKELEVHDESTLKLCNELLTRIEKLESKVG